MNYKKPNTQTTHEEQLAIPDYPSTEGVFNQLHEESEIDPEDMSKNKLDIRISNTHWETNPDQEKSGSDLDIRGSKTGDKHQSPGV